MLKVVSSVWCCQILELRGGTRGEGGRALGRCPGGFGWGPASSSLLLTQPVESGFALLHALPPTRNSKTIHRMEASESFSLCELIFSYIYFSEVKSNNMISNGTK